MLESIFNLLAHCSLSCLFRLAKVLSFFIARTNNQVSRNTKDNIALCFSNKSPKERKTLYHQSIRHTVCSFIELAAIWHYKIEEVLKLIQKVDLSDEYNLDKKGKIIIVPHCGSWELMNNWLAQTGGFYALYKPAKSTQLDNYILKKRSRNGAVLVPTNLKGLRGLLKAMKNGITVVILPDQKPGEVNASVLSKFYGFDAPTGLLINSLTQKVDCSVYIGTAFRNFNSPSYHIKISKLNEDNLSQEPQASADYLNYSIEQFINYDEAQYQWSYRRYQESVYENNLSDKPSI